VIERHGECFKGPALKGAENCWLGSVLAYKTCQ